MKSVAYGIIDCCMLGRGVPRSICGETIRIPAQWCRYYPSDYEPATFEFLRKHCRQSDTVLDIGAHLGLFSVLMARRVGASGRVFSFEPSNASRSVLLETARLNKCEDIIEIHGKAIGQTSGTVTFYETGDVVSNANSLVRTERSKTSVTVDAVSIDDFVHSRALNIRCMKIDVEGAEFDALLGGQQTFMSCRPYVHLGLHPKSLGQGGGSLAEVWDLAKRLKMVVTQRGLQIDANYFCEQTDLFDVDLIPEV